MIASYTKGKDLFKHSHMKKSDENIFNNPSSSIDADRIERQRYKCTKNIY